MSTIYYPATTLLRIADELALGEIAMADKRPDDAVSHFRTAVTAQDGLPYMEPPFWYYPTRHSLGKALLAAGKAAEAEAVYRRDLEDYPLNGWATFGLMQALKAQGKDATDVTDRFASIWSQADVRLTSSTF